MSISGDDGFPVSISSPRSGGLPVMHILLAIAVVAVWGTNFVVIRTALDHMPPLLFAALRFSFLLVPAAFFVRRPSAPWRRVAAYGLFMGAAQFGLLNIAMNGFISPGLASLLMQGQMVFTIGFAVLFSGEHVRRYQLVALPLAIAGILVILMNADGETTPFGLLLILGGAFSWAIGNHIVRSIDGPDMLPCVIWSSLFSVPPLLLCTLLIDGPHTVWSSLTGADLFTWVAVAWQSLAVTMFGFTAWGWLLARHSAGTIAPLSLLVPVFGMSTSALLLGESMPAWKLFATALVIGGLSINFLWPAVQRRRIRTAVQAA